MVQCGGFDPGSMVKIVKEPDPNKCQLELRCHTDKGPCGGIIGGQAEKKEEDGTVVLDFCLPPGIDGTNAVETIFVHELTHAAQLVGGAP